MDGSNRQESRRSDYNTTPTPMANYPSALVHSHAVRPHRARRGGRGGRRASRATTRAAVDAASKTGNPGDIQTTPATTKPIQGQKIPQSSSINNGLTDIMEEEEKNAVEENDVGEDDAEVQIADDYNNTTVRTSSDTNSPPTRRYPSRSKSRGRKGFSAVNATPTKRTSFAKVTTPTVAQDKIPETEDRMDTDDDSPIRSTIAARPGTSSTTGSSERYSPATTVSTASSPSTTNKNNTPRKKAKRTIERIFDHKLSTEGIGASFNTFDLFVKWNNNKVPEWWTEDKLWDEHKVDILKYWGVESEKRRKALTKIPTDKRKNGWLSRIDARLPADANTAEGDTRATAWRYVLEYVGYPYDVTEELTYHELEKRAPRLIKEYAKKEGLRLPGK